MFCPNGSLIFIGVLFVCYAQAKEFQFLNNLPEEAWIGSLGNADKPPLNIGGWKLGAGQRMSVQSDDDWAGRFWARNCANSSECNGAEGEPSGTVAEITLRGPDGNDYYDISLVDGFNLNMSITPLEGQGDGSQNSCASVSCDQESTHDCPQEQIGSSGQVIACRSACYAYDNNKSTFTCKAPAYLIIFG